MSIRLYEVNSKYIDYLIPYAPHLFHNKKPGQHNERKYIGIILIVNNMNYFTPLSSYKPKHDKMKNCLDFLKIGNYAVININNMFPVPEGEYQYVHIPEIKNTQYQKLLMAEYRLIKKLQDRIKRNAALTCNLRNNLSAHQRQNLIYPQPAHRHDHDHCGNHIYNGILFKLIAHINALRTCCCDGSIRYSDYTRKDTFLPKRYVHFISSTSLLNTPTLSPTPQNWLSLKTPVPASGVKLALRVWILHRFWQRLLVPFPGKW